MKHLFEFHSFMNEGTLTTPFDPVKEIDIVMPLEREISPEWTPNSTTWAPIVKLTELNAKKLLNIYVHTRPIICNYEDIRNNTYDSIARLPAHNKITDKNGKVRPKLKPLSGVTYLVVNDNTLKLTFPEVQLSIEERSVISISCSQLVNPDNGHTGALLQNFDRPGRGIGGDDAVWFHDYSSGFTKPIEKYPNGKPIAGKVYKGTLKRNVPGGILNIIIDMTKTSGWASFDDEYELMNARRASGMFGPDR